MIRFLKQALHRCKASLYGLNLLSAILLMFLYLIILLFLCFVAVLAVYARLQGLRDAINKEWENITEADVLLFLGFVNNLRSLDSSEECVIALLEVYRIRFIWCTILTLVAVLYVWALLSLCETKGRQR